MNEFETTLRRRVGTVYQELATAKHDDRDYEIELHSARLEELLDLARRHGVDATCWGDLDTEIPRQYRP